MPNLDHLDDAFLSAVADYFDKDIDQLTERDLWKYEELEEGDEADAWLDDPRNDWREL